MSSQPFSPSLLTRFDQGAKSRSARVWSSGMGWVRGVAAHDDPLAESSNWVALLIGTHLPFWPLYVWWCAGTQAFPSSLLTMALAPAFLLIPLVTRWSGLLGRVAMLLAGLANTVFTVWVLGERSGTELFLVPCAVLAAMSFRRPERWLMLAFTALPIVIWYVLRDHAPAPLHHYDAGAARELFVLNAISIGVLIAAFGWLQGDIYRRMEAG